ncbi:MAG: EamA family transporter RarD [Phycisphaerae bacterium]|nr:EamA family transporter RarD [Phycisphaerae bacterium]
MTRQSQHTAPRETAAGSAALESSHSRDAAVGVLYGAASYAWWGLVPIYFKAVAHVPALEVLAFRVMGAVVLLGLLMAAYRRWPEVRGLLMHRRTMLALFATTVLIATNWLTFIWSVAHNVVMQASLGYFINPLVNVLLGFVFLGERLRRWQTVSVILATAGVSYLTWAHGGPPGIALILAFSFGLYGLLRKTVRVDALVGLTVETCLLTPIALGYLAAVAWSGTMAFGHEGTGTDILLLSAGIITAVPLLWFTNAARRLRLATIGFLQYIAPTMQFLLAVLAFGEPFTHDQLISFALIWSALAIYSADTLAWSRKLSRLRKSAT